MSAWPEYYLVTWDTNAFDAGYKSMLVLARSHSGAKRLIVEAYDYAANVKTKRMETQI